MGALKSFGATLVSGAMVLGTALGMSIGIVDAPASCLLLPAEDGNSYALNVVWASTPEGDVALIRVDGLVYAIAADDLPSRTRPSNPPSVSSLPLKAIPNNRVAEWYDADPADAIPRKALPGAFVAELDLPAGQRVSLGDVEGLGTWAKLGGDVALVLNEDDVFWAIPSNVVRSAIPSNAIPSNAIPAEAIPSNAIPSNAIPSNMWTRALPGKWLAEANLAAGERVILEPNRGGWSTPTSGVWSMAGDQPAVVVRAGDLLWAIPSNARSLAIPSNLRPEKAIPAEAIPSNAIPSNLTASVLNDASPGKWLAEAGLAAGEVVTLEPGASPGVGAWAMAADEPALIVKAGELLWAIPSNETSLDRAIPSNQWPDWALPASALPASAIPSNAIPSNLKNSVLNDALPASVLAEAHLRAGGIAPIGGKYVAFTWVQTAQGVAMALPASALPASALPASIVGDFALLPGSELVGQALPASALPASALPASALPASALPASALPASALPASALPASAIPSNFSALLLSIDQALALGDAALPASALPASALPASALPASALPAAGLNYGVSWLTPRTDDATVIRGSVVDPTIRGSIVPGTPPVPRDRSGADARGCTPVERFGVAVSGGIVQSENGSTVDSWWNEVLVLRDPQPPRRDGTIEVATDTFSPATGGPGSEVDTDRDDDGYPATRFGGGDCSDYNPDVHPDAIDIPGDGIDQDCDGKDAVDPGQEIGEDTDKDDDGHRAVKFGGGDCNDTNAAINPDAVDTPGDGIDQDCDGKDATKTTVDPDTDGDGYVGSDCDNDDPTIHPGATDIPGDGIDQDCDGKDATTDDSVPPPPSNETLVVSAVEVYGPSVIEESLIVNGAQYCDSPFETWIDAWMDREVDGQYVDTAENDLKSVWMSWKIAGLLGSAEMQYLQTDLWSAQFGPFDADTISGGSDFVVTITVTMTRLDNTTDTGTTQVTLHDCDPPLEG